MKNLILVLILGCVLVNCKPKSSEHDHASKETETPVAVDTVKKSIPKEEHASIGSAHVMMKYHAPAVRGRTIWGGLVPYGEVWVTGAHSATSIEFDKEIELGAQKISAGKYALFTIPGAEKWTVIVNTNWEQHLADDYDQKEDLVRVEITPEITSDVRERLKFYLVDNNGEGAIVFRWEKIKLSIPFKVVL
jgi:hypothetical protein